MTPPRNLAPDDAGFGAVGGPGLVRFGKPRSIGPLPPVFPFFGLRNLVLDLGDGIVAYDSLHELVAFSVVTGAVLWRKPREDRHLVGADAGDALVLGGDPESPSLAALERRTGEPRGRAHMFEGWHAATECLDLRGSALQYPEGEDAAGMVLELLAGSTFAFSMRGQTKSASSHVAGTVSRANSVVSDFDIAACIPPLVLCNNLRAIVARDAAGAILWGQRGQVRRVIGDRALVQTLLGELVVVDARSGRELESPRRLPEPDGELLAWTAWTAETVVAGSSSKLVGWSRDAVRVWERGRGRVTMKPCVTANAIVVLETSPGVPPSLATLDPDTGELRARLDLPDQQCDLALAAGVAIVFPVVDRLAEGEELEREGTFVLVGES